MKAFAFAGMPDLEDDFSNPVALFAFDGESLFPCAIFKHQGLQARVEIAPFTSTALALLLLCLIPRELELQAMGKRTLFALSSIGALALLSACGGGGSSNTVPRSPVLTSIKVTAANGNVTVGQTQQMKATGLYNNNTSQDLTNSATWTSSDSTVATISATGMLTAKNSGNCSIAANVGPVSGSFNVTVAPGLVSIVITPTNPSIAPATTLQLNATGTYSDNSTQNLTSTVQWSSSDISVATISSTFPTAGTVKAVASGAVTITASLGTVSASATLTVTSATAISIVVSPTNVSLPLGLQQQFTANATFSDGSNQDVTNTATWKSSTTSIASITTSGLATAKNVGTTTISASFGGINNSTPLSVNAANLNSISIQPSNGSIAQGTRIQLAAIGTFNDGGTRDITHSVNWVSSDPTTASVGTLNGFTFGASPGIATITASLGNASDSVPLNVTSAKIVSISLTPASATVPVGGHAHFTATGVFDDSSTQNISASSTWTSTNTAVATVGSSSGTYGLVSGVSAGSANVNAGFTYGGASATGSRAVTVSSATLVSISVTPSSALVAPGSGQQFTATGTFSDGSRQNITQSVTWSSSDNTVATVNSSGTAIGQLAGTVTITAQSGSPSASASLVVESSALTSIQVKPQSPSTPATTQVQFQAIGTFADGSTQNLTSTVTWTSSASSIATISNTSGSLGVATAIQPGTTTISPVFQGQVGTANLTVTNATLVSISVTPSSPAITANSTQQFTAKGTFSDGSVVGITTQCTWSSSNLAVATVNGNGLASGLASGASTISASMNGVTGAAILTVQ